MHVLYGHNSRGKTVRVIEKALEIDAIMLTIYKSKLHIFCSNIS